MFIHLTLVPYIKAANETKTKPTQHSVKELRSIGIQPDVLLCRCENEITDEERAKIALFTNVPKKAVMSALDARRGIYEIPMLLTVITVLMITGTMNLREIVDQQAGGFWNWNICKLAANPLMPVTFVVFFICMLAETNRAPFDMAEAESELVAGAFTEYAGMGFGVFFMAEYANILVGCSLATILFFGGWQSPIGVLPGHLWFLIKLYLLIFTVVWVRWTFPRTQFYRLLNLSWKILIPLSLGTLLLTAAMLKLF